MNLIDVMVVVAKTVIVVLIYSKARNHYIKAESNDNLN